MAAKKTSAETSAEIIIRPIRYVETTVRIIGMTPLYMHAMAAKAKRTLLLGGGKKTAADKVEIKHDPETEFREAAYTLEDGPTLLAMMAGAVKSAMGTAALVTPGMKKVDVQRLVKLPQEFFPVWGKPYLKCDVVRSADMNRTPDVRTRPILPNWCGEIVIQYATPHLSSVGIYNLISNAGNVAGIGDFRQEKGRGNYGTFSPVMDGDEEMEAKYAAIVEQSREVQQAAMEAAEPYDAPTRELLAIVRQEQLRRAA
jgi:hypothetical protein